MTDEEEPSELDHPHPFLQFFLMADLRRLRSLSLQGTLFLRRPYIRPLFGELG